MTKSDHDRSWLVLIHHFPQDPGSLRVKVWRRLQAIGAISLKGSVYVLPQRSQSQEDFEWILREIRAGGGEGAVAQADFIAGMSDSQIQSLFDEARQKEYQSLADEIRAEPSRIAAAEIGQRVGEGAAAIVRYRRKLAEIEAIDYFGANGREAVHSLLNALAQALEAAEHRPDDQSQEPLTMESIRGSVWVTRQNVFMDRIASAWLIRHWIDPDGTFKFTSDKDYQPVEREIRFDMFQAEFTHEGDQCTFEVLLSRFGLRDPALGSIGQIVHDIDLKDHKYKRDETSGVANLIAGIAAGFDSDDQRIERGGLMLDDLYQFFRKSNQR